jgi:electron transfer flavoprotein alpha subunit
MKKAVGILVELEDGQYKNANSGVITLARTAEDVQIYAIAVNADHDLVTPFLCEYGVQYIIHLSLPDNLQHNPDVTARAVIDVMSAHDMDTLMGLSTSVGKDILPRIAALLDVPLVMDCIAVDLNRNLAQTSQYSGKTVATVKVSGPKSVFGIRPNVIEPVPEKVAAQTQEFDGSRTAAQGLKLVKKGSVDDLSAISLAEAEVIVSGGRGMKNGDNFELLARCAKLLKGAVGASRVAVDSGWVPYAMQVGQTGEKVSPKVYIACGISGSIQHFAGMKTAGMIIAVNTDDTAAIVANCDYYAKADALDVIPKIIQVLENG